MGAVVAIFMIILYVGLLILTIGGYWKTFTKAGQPGWACIIPIYNILVMADIAKVSRNQAWKGIGVLLVGIVFYFIALTQGIQGGNPSGSMVIIGMLIYFACIILSLVFFFPIYKGIALNFGQSVGFAWGLMLLNVIFFAILGWGNYQYQDGSFKDDSLLDSDL
jgi:hypothetical protein